MVLCGLHIQDFTSRHLATASTDPQNIAGVYLVFLCPGHLGLDLGNPVPYQGLYAAFQELLYSNNMFAETCSLFENPHRDKNSKTPTPGQASMAEKGVAAVSQKV